MKSITADLSGQSSQKTRLGTVWEDCDRTGKINYSVIAIGSEQIKIETLRDLRFIAARKIAGRPEWFGKSQIHQTAPDCAK
jgi:hypothetical protein